MGDRKGDSASSLPATSAGPGTRRNRVPTAICGSNDEIRILLRGVLTLHRYPVAAEAASPTGVGGLPPETRILIYDVGSDAARWTESVSALTRENPGIQVLALLPPGSDGSRLEMGSTGTVATLVKPFKVQDLILAIDALAADPGTP